MFLKSHFWHHVSYTNVSCSWWAAGNVWKWEDVGQITKTCWYLNNFIQLFPVAFPRDRNNSRTRGITFDPLLSSVITYWWNKYLSSVEYKQPRPGSELGSLCPFPSTVTITTRVPPNFFYTIQLEQITRYMCVCVCVCVCTWIYI